MTQQDTQASNVVVSGIITICSCEACVLFDSGSTHSYVSPHFAKHFISSLDKLDEAFLVTTPMGESLLVEYVYCSCEIFVSGRETMIDLMILEMTAFDVILGMDWLVSCHVILDCHNKAVKFDKPGEPSFMFQGDQSEVPYNLISTLGAQRLLRKGC